MVSPADPHQPSNAMPAAAQADPLAHLARKVAHELNSPLDGVMRFIALAQRKVREKHYDDIGRYLADAEFGLQRMAEILRDLTDVKSVAPSGDVDFGELLEQTTRTFHSVAEKQRVQFSVDRPPCPAPRVDVHLYQVLCNLIKNALEAMPDGGSVTIGAHHSAATGRFVLTVLDTGHGIAPQHQDRLFEPFFTTKGQGQGMGLGLALCRDVLTKLGGSITLANRADQRGCQATVELPVRA